MVKSFCNTTAQMYKNNPLHEGSYVSDIIVSPDFDAWQLVYAKNTGSKYWLLRKEARRSGLSRCKTISSKTGNSSSITAVLAYDPFTDFFSDQPLGFVRLPGSRYLVGVLLTLIYHQLKFNII